MIDPVRLAAIQQRVEKATEGPWSHYSDKLRPTFPTPIHAIVDTYGKEVVKWSGFDGVNLRRKQIDANAEFLAEARQDIPYLLSAVTALQEAIREWKEAEDVCPPGVTHWTRRAQLVEARTKLRSLVADAAIKHMI